MKAYTMFQQYVWLVKTIQEEHRISLENLNSKWLKSKVSDGAELARSTFNRHREAIEEIFGIVIECDRKDGFSYYIAKPKTVDDAAIAKRLLASLGLRSKVESKSCEARFAVDQTYLDNEPTEKIVIRAYGKEAGRLRELPLHASQQEVYTSTDSADFEMTLHPTEAFTKALLAGGADIKVVEPQWLGDNLIEHMNKAIRQYEELF